MTKEIKFPPVPEPVGYVDPYGNFEKTLQQWMKDETEATGMPWYAVVPLDQLHAYARPILEQRDELAEAVEEYEGKIESWAGAYPYSVFREPSDDELAKAHIALQSVGLTLDLLSASAMRYVATSLAAHFMPVKQARAALAKLEKTS
jgi:hypothetical protein